MKHAGVAVSVTTFTDVIAFFIGSNTVLPGLQSFCIYAAVAIFAIYVLQITHFVAWFSLGTNIIKGEGFVLFTSFIEEIHKITKRTLP